MRLGLKEVADIIKTLGICTEIPDMHGMLKVNKELYIYVKRGNTLTITCEDGKSLSVAVDCSVKECTDIHGRSYELPVHEVYFEYGLSNGELLSFNKELHLDGLYEGFENVNRHDLLTDTNTSYVDAKGDTLASFTTELTNITLKNSKKTYIFALGGRSEPIATIEGDAESTIDDCAHLTKEAKAALLVRVMLEYGISKCAIEPTAIDIVSKQFREDVLACKKLNNGTAR